MAAIELYNTPLFSDPYLKAYYRLEDVSDSGPSGITLTNNNTVSFASAVFNNGADFGSGNTNKSLTSANTIGIDGGAITMVGYFKMKAEISTGYQCFISQANQTSDVRYLIAYNYNSGTRRLEFVRGKYGVSSSSVTHNITLGTSSFYQIGLTYDGINIVAYVNGSPVETPVAASGNGSGQPNQGISIATDIGNNFTDYASILADECAFFSRALTATEMSNLYNGTWGGPKIVNFI